MSDSLFNTPERNRNPSYAMPVLIATPCNIG
jgi:hypothetical protein